MHKFISGLLCITIVAGWCFSLVMADDKAALDNGQMCIPLGVISLEPPETVEAKRSPVDFPHALHFDYACMECHHQWSATDETIQSCGVSGCHELDAPPEPDSGDDPILYYKNAYHVMCIGCHKEIKAVNKKIAMTMGQTGEQLKPTGPTGCIQCHPK